MKKITLILCLELLSLMPGAEEYQFIDGFKIDTGPGYSIRGLERNMEDYFIINKDEAEAFYAIVLYDKGENSFKRLLLQTARGEYSDLNDEKWDEFIQLTWENYAENINGFRVRLEFGERGYQVFALDLRPSPGLAVTLLLFPSRDWEEPRQEEELNLLLKQLELVFMDAAG